MPTEVDAPVIPPEGCVRHIRCTVGRGAFVTPAVPPEELRSLHPLYAVRGAFVTPAVRREGMFVIPATCRKGAFGMLPAPTELVPINGWLFCCRWCSAKTRVTYTSGRDDGRTGNGSSATPQPASDDELWTAPLWRQGNAPLHCKVARLWAGVGSLQMTGICADLLSPRGQPYLPRILKY